MPGASPRTIVQDVRGGLGASCPHHAVGADPRVPALRGRRRRYAWIGAAFLLWLAWRIATAGRSETDGGRKPVGFVGAAAFQWINPKSWLVSASVVGTYLNAASGSALVQATTLAVLFVVAATPCCFVWLAFGASAQRVLRTARALRIFNVVMAALLAGSIGLMLF